MMFNGEIFLGRKEVQVGNDESILLSTYFSQIVIWPAQAQACKK
jgi:hypothetical protein